MDITIVLLALIALAVCYKLGLFSPVIELSAVAARESEAYNREHTIKVAKRYLSSENVISAADVKKINDNIKAIDSINFD